MVKEKGGVNVRANEERGICGTVKSNRCRWVIVSQRSSDGEGKICREDEGVLCGGDEKRESVAVL